MSDGDRPFRTLGWHLKLAREQLCESLDEVSGAVEIEIDTLEKIEAGKTRPTEDVLMLLVNHFDIADAEANSLWELAGYVTHKDDHVEPNQTFSVDPRIIYTDLAHVSVNDFGVVMSFLQASSTGNQPLLVSRVGMSQEQAKQVVQLLQQSLAQVEAHKTKILPPKNKQTKKD